MATMLREQGVGGSNPLTPTSFQPGEVGGFVLPGPRSDDQRQSREERMSEFLNDFRWYDALGVIGSILIVAGYFAVSNKKMDASLPPFQLLNLAGAVMLIVSLAYRPNAGALLIEVLWAVIALVTLTRYFLKQ